MIWARVFEVSNAVFRDGSLREWLECMNADIIDELLHWWIQNWMDAGKWWRLWQVSPTGDSGPSLKGVWCPGLSVLCLSSVMRWVPPRAAHHDTLLPHTHPEAKTEILRQKTSFPLVYAITVVQVITHHAYFWVRGKISQVWANCFWCAYIAKESRLRLIYWSQMRSYILTEDPSLPL